MTRISRNLLQVASPDKIQTTMDENCMKHKET